MSQCHLPERLRFSPNREVVLLVRGKARVREEDLQERPDISCCFLRCSDGRGSVREAGADGLVDVEPANRVSRWNVRYSSPITYILETSFHELGFKVTSLLSLVMRQGPFSWKRPTMLELPGCRVCVS